MKDKIAISREDAKSTFEDDEIVDVQKVKCELWTLSSGEQVVVANVEERPHNMWQTA